MFWDHYVVVGPTIKYNTTSGGVALVIATPGADCNFASPEVVEMPDAPLSPPLFVVIIPIFVAPPDCRPARPPVTLQTLYNIGLIKAFCITYSGDCTSWPRSFRRFWGTGNGNYYNYSCELQYCGAYLL